MIADTHFAARRLRTHRGYALLAVLTLALGVGGMASTYAAVRGVLFDALPYAHGREVGVFWKKTDWTEEEFLHVRGREPGFRDVAPYRHIDVIQRVDLPPGPLPLGSGGPWRMLALAVVSVLGGRVNRASAPKRRLAGPLKPVS